MSAKPESLNLAEWQEYMDEAKYELKREGGRAPLAMRCEDTVFTTGWHSGGFTMNGYTYKAFCPRALFGPCAMLVVREDFLKWVEKRLRSDAKAEREMKERAEREIAPVQGEFAL